MENTETDDTTVDWEQEWKNHLYREAWMPLYKGVFSLTAVRIGFLLLCVGTIAGMFVNTDGLFKYGLSIHKLFVHASASLVAALGAGLSFIGFCVCISVFATHYSWGGVKDNLLKHWPATRKRRNTWQEKIRFFVPAMVSTGIAFFIFASMGENMKDIYFFLIEIRDDL